MATAGITERDAQVDILRDFIADEDKGSGQFWAMNWRPIGSLAAKAATLLPPNEAERFFVHFMRRAPVPAVPQSALPLLLAAYRAFLPQCERGGFMHDWTVPTFLFGFVGGATTAGELRDAATLKERLKLVNHILKFAYMRGLREKLKSFLPFTAQAGHIHDVLRLLGYRLDYGQGDNDAYDYTNVRFWGFVAVVLLSRDHRAALLAEMLDDGLDLPKRDKIMSVLNTFVQAVRPEAGPEETEFHALATWLAARERARADQTEAAALARQLGLPFEEGEDWGVGIWIPPAGIEIRSNTPHLRLDFRPHPNYDWHLWIEGERRFSEHGGKVTQNDPGIAPLGRGNLAAFPAWLRQIGESHGLFFDCAKARIYCGKKRSAGKILARWLESGA